MTPRHKIVRDFAEWTALSSARSGSDHAKSRAELYPLLRLPDYGSILVGGQISQLDFDGWHKKNTLQLNAANGRLPIGWAAKLLNVYLKTCVYLAGQGRRGLIEHIHPPLDDGLWRGIKREYGNVPEIWGRTKKMKPIKGITDYQEYSDIIEGCRLIAQRRNILLIEVEELWKGTEL